MVIWLYGCMVMLMQKAPKLEILKGLKLGSLPTVGRRALGGSYDF